MMYSSPFFYPPFNNRYYPKKPLYNSYHYNHIPNHKGYYSSEKLQPISNNDSSYHKKNDEKNPSSHQTENDSVIFNIFGIPLHLDDLILLFIIYFLYTENTKDDMLFVVLILLLLS